MRPHGKTKLGFFPLPAPEAERLKNCLAFASEFSALDPCVGDGVAVSSASAENPLPAARRAFSQPLPHQSRHALSPLRSAIVRPRFSTIGRYCPLELRPLVGAPIKCYYITLLG